jgi:hypothetical protein
MEDVAFWTGVGSLVVISLYWSMLNNSRDTEENVSRPNLEEIKEEFRIRPVGYERKNA